jgi:hypothetical protein
MISRELIVFDPDEFATSVEEYSLEKFRMGE